MVCKAAKNPNDYSPNSIVRLLPFYALTDLLQQAFDRKKMVCSMFASTILLSMPAPQKQGKQFHIITLKKTDTSIP